MGDVVIKRAIWPSFFIIPALGFALLISSIEGYVFWWAGLASLILPLMIGLPRSWRWTPLAMATVAFIAYLLLQVFFLSPAFTTRGLYFVCFFAAGFLVFARLSQEQIEVAFRATVAVFALLSLWAIFQYLTGQGYLARAWPRVNTIFFTPNTFAAALNLVLLPLIARYLHGNLFGDDKKRTLVFVLLLFTALLLTRSRGGQLTFLAGLMALWGIGFISRKYRADRRLWFKLLAGFIMVFSVLVLYQGYRATGAGAGLFGGMATVTRLDGEVRSGTERLKIYDIAWRRFREKPLLGHGYYHFQYYQLRDQPLSRKGIITKFAHNDYLQMGMETGVVGLALLLGVMLTFYVTLLKHSRSSSRHTVPAAALVAGLSAYFAHAMVDFVMYPPVLLLLFGACLGVTQAEIAGEGKRWRIFDSGWLAGKGLRPSVVRMALGVFLIAWLAQPAIAQLAFDQARRDVRRLDIESALKYFELARRFAPYEPVYYSAEADIWYHAAIATRDPEPARRAEELLARGVAVNPREMGNLFLRALLHREVPELLEEPAGLETVLAWLEQVMQWHPHDNRVQMEYVATLQRLGRTEEARRRLSEYAERYPDSVLISRALERYGDLPE